MAAEKAAAKRKFFVGGNWKCNGTVKSTTELCDGLSKIDTTGVMYHEIMHRSLSKMHKKYDLRYIYIYICIG